MNKLIIIVLLSILGCYSSNAQEKEKITATIKVEGICDMCKSRIEEAAYIKGVKFAEWNKATKELTIVYRADKTNLQEVAGHIAAAGHDNEYIITEDSTYYKISSCCRYREMETH